MATQVSPTPNEERLAKMFVEIARLAFSTKELLVEIGNSSATSEAAVVMLSLIGGIADQGIHYSAPDNNTLRLDTFAGWMGVDQFERTGGEA